MKRVAGTGRSLSTYRDKRDAARTPEPFGIVRPQARSEPGVDYEFVIQQHAARRLHWDFRLEIDGALVSWAVPRGPSVDPAEKRLAVQTEDHPMEYGGFEGNIPAGNYGAGAVILWDRGVYRTIDGVAPADGLAAGKLDIELYGHKLRGRWALVRTKRGEGKDWLLFKKPDGRATAPEPVEAAPESVLSGLTVEERERDVTRDEELAGMARAAGAPERPLPVAALSPMLATRLEKAFSRDGWIFELKYDGVRALVMREGEAVRILSRTGRDYTATFPEIADAARHLPCDSFVLDGEVVDVEQRPTGSFERLQQRLGLTEPAAVDRARIGVPVVLYAFDLLAAAGHDLRSLPLVARKEILRRLVTPRGTLRWSEIFERDGEALFDAASEHGLEGIVAKRAGAPYQSGRRTRDWLKIKAPRTAVLAIVGYLPGKGSHADLGSIMLAWHDGGEFVYAGNAGSGLDARTSHRLRAELDASRRADPPFRKPAAPLARGARFADPRLVAEVRFTEVTNAGLLRHPVFVRLREDETPAGCEPPPSQSEPQRAAPANQPPAPKPQPPSSDPLRLTNLDKVFWPDEGYTKGDLLQFYETIWPFLAPYLNDRPLVLTRYPDGIAGKNFFQKNAPDFTPDWVTTCVVEDTEYFVCNRLEELLYVVNSACIPLHLWSARAASIEHPDWAILDLDPKEAPFDHVVRIARHVHALLDDLGTRHYIKTSGQDGLHILIPLDRQLDHEQSTLLCEVLARVVVHDLPDIATVVRRPAARGGKVYVDYLQNGFGKTIAGPFSVRPRKGAPVSTPLDWREVTAKLVPSSFTIRSVPARMKRRTDPMRDVLGPGIDVPSTIAALQARLAAGTR